MVDFVSSFWSSEDVGFVIDAEVSDIVKVSDLPESGSFRLPFRPFSSYTVEGHTYTFDIVYSPDKYGDYVATFFKDGEFYKETRFGSAKYMNIKQMGFAGVTTGGTFPDGRWVYLEAIYMDQIFRDGEYVIDWQVVPYPINLGKHLWDEFITIGGACDVYPATPPLVVDPPDFPMYIPLPDAVTGEFDIPLVQEGVYYPDIPDEKLQTFPVDTPVDLDKVKDGTWESDIPDNPPVDVPDTPTSIPGILQGLWDFLKGILQGIADGITSIAGAIGAFFDSPSNFKLDFDGFKNLIVLQKFPFCIPFDFVNAVRLFAATAAGYQLQIDIDTDYLQVHHTVDLSPFAVPLAFFRYAACIWFGFILVMRTRDLIKW